MYYKVIDFYRETILSLCIVNFSLTVKNEWYTYIVTHCQFKSISRKSKYIHKDALKITTVTTQNSRRDIFHDKYWIRLMLGLHI